MTFKSLCLVLCLTLFAIEVNGSKYYVAYKRTANFYQAWQQCRLYGGHLASIESNAERAQAEAAVLAVGDFKREWFIGITDLGSEGNYVSIGLNKPATYLYFYPMQPDNYQGNEHCLVMGAASTRYWNDVWCGTNAVGFICAYVRQ